MQKPQNIKILVMVIKNPFGFSIIGIRLSKLSINTDESIVNDKNDEIKKNNNEKIDSILFCIIISLKIF